jgi:hypothetical protein
VPISPGCRTNWSPPAGARSGCAPRAGRELRTASPRTSCAPAVPGHLRVERGGQHLALAHRHRMPSARWPAPRPRVPPAPPGSPDEHAWISDIQSGEGDIGLERVDLTTEGVAAHRHIDAAPAAPPPGPGSGIQNLGGQHDHPGARSVGRSPSRSIPRSAPAGRTPAEDGSSRSIHRLE